MQYQLCTRNTKYSVPSNSNSIRSTNHNHLRAKGNQENQDLLYPPIGVIIAIIIVL